MSNNKSRALALVSIIALFAPIGAAYAQPAYNASDIVAHFAPAKKANLGTSRAICIGTESECPKEVPAQPKVVSNFDLRINFDYNSANLTSAARTNLDEFARALQDPALTGSQFVVEGHTDGTGSDAFNLDLSMRRARSVVSFLAARGIPSDRIEAKGFGKLKPLVPDIRSGENRRVEAHLRSE